MSAFAAVVIGDRIEILTDGAIYNEDGILLDARQKVWTSPIVPLAVTGRGCATKVELIAKSFLTFSRMGSVDRALDAFAGALSLHGDVPTSHFEMVIAAISETRGPVIYYMATTNAHDIPDFEPLKLYDFGPEIAGGPMLAAERGAALSAAWDPERGLTSIGVPLFEAMRATKGKNPARPDLPEHYGIGGHIDLTVVAPGGCTVERIHTWPDEIGLPIDPSKGEWVAGLMMAARRLHGAH